MKVVIALGGNALGNDVSTQKENITKAIKDLIPVLKDNQVVLTHGNGPQVGMINKVFNDSNINMPFPESTAMSQGYIGYHMIKELKKQLKENNINKKVVAVITEVGVSKDDIAFENPTKPIGNFYTKEEAEELMKIDNSIYKEDSGRGYRKYIASPEPVVVDEYNTINNLLENNYIVISVGGGGIPYLVENNLPCEAVIDKDKASAKLANLIKAEKLIILTAVDNVQINFGQESAKSLFEVSISDVSNYLKNGEFGEGSMKPKIEASLKFLEDKNSKEVVITSLDKVSKIKEATIIKK